MYVLYSMYVHICTVIWLLKTSFLLVNMKTKCLPFSRSPLKENCCSNFRDSKNENKKPKFHNANAVTLVPVAVPVFKKPCLLTPFNIISY